jgi:hypothetical protein
MLDTGAFLSGVKVFGDVRPFDREGLGSFPGKRIRSRPERAALLAARPVR